MICLFLLKIHHLANDSFLEKQIVRLADILCPSHILRVPLDLHRPLPHREQCLAGYPGTRGTIRGPSSHGPVQTLISLRKWREPQLSVSEADSDVISVYRNVKNVIVTLH